MLDQHFFLPIANKPAHRQMKDAAHTLMTTYARDHADDLFRVWESERPFELRLDGITVTGRADVILDHENGVPTALAILDYKTSTSAGRDHDLQLQVYASAGMKEGLDVQGAYVHDLSAARPDRRMPVPIASHDLDHASTQIAAAGESIRLRAFAPSPGPGCTKCEVRMVCPDRA